MKSGGGINGPSSETLVAVFCCKLMGEELINTYINFTVSYSMHWQWDQTNVVKMVLI